MHLENHLSEIGEILSAWSVEFVDNDFNPLKGFNQQWEFNMFYTQKWTIRRAMFNKKRFGLRAK